MKFSVNGRLVVLTGAASGIGSALARGLAVRGANLALIDRDGAGLDGVAGNMRLFGVKVSVHQADLADPAAIAALPEQVLAAHQGADAAALINNAGAAMAGRFDQITDAEFSALMDVNFWSGVRMTRAFLPLLLGQAEARLVFLSSVFGLIGPPGQTAYAASKFAIRGFAEALRHELADTGLGVTIVHPGGVRTSIARNARMASGFDASLAAQGIAEFEKSLRTSPDEAALLILRGIERQSPRVLIGSDAIAIDLIQRASPAQYWRSLRRSFGNSERANRIPRPPRSSVKATS